MLSIIATDASLFPHIRHLLSSCGEEGATTNQAQPQQQQPIHTGNETTQPVMMQPGQNTTYTGQNATYTGQNATLGQPAAVSSNATNTTEGWEYSGPITLFAPTNQAMIEAVEYARALILRWQDEIARFVPIDDVFDAMRAHGFDISPPAENSKGQNTTSMNATEKANFDNCQAMQRSTNASLIMAKYFMSLFPYHVSQLAQDSCIALACACEGT